MSNVKPIDIETGEIRTDYTLRHRNQDAAYKTIRTAEGRKSDFTFTSMENIATVIGKIDDKHCGYLLYLQTFISYEDGLLVMPTHSKAPMTRNDIKDVIGLQRTAFSAFMNDMLTNNIIAEADGRYFVNSAYHFRGNTNNALVVKTFTAKVRGLYTGKNANKLGFIYKLIPFIHFETNTICANPYEKDVGRIVQLTKAQIADLTGVSEKTVFSYLRSLKLGDEFVFAEIRRGNQRYYKINPFIFYRKKGEPDATLREMFRLGFSGK